MSTSLWAPALPSNLLCCQLLRLQLITMNLRGRMPWDNTQPLYALWFANIMWGYLPSSSFFIAWLPTCILPSLTTAFWRSDYCSHFPLLGTCSLEWAIQPISHATGIGLWIFWTILPSHEYYSAAWSHCSIRLSLRRLMSA